MRSRVVSFLRGRTGAGALAGGLVVSGVIGLVFFGARPDAAAEKPKAAKTAPKEFECRWTDGPIKIDGRGDEEAWKHAQVIDNFYLPWLGDKARPARTATKAKLLWDREYLYFLAEMEDTDLYADVTEHDGMTWTNDVFELFFKPADGKPGYYEFQVNAAGAVLDMFLPRRGAGGYQRFRKDGDFHVEAKVHLRGTLNRWQDKDEGWSVEGRIPWSDFLRTGGRPETDERWKFALCRYDYSVDFEGPSCPTCAPLKTNKSPDFHYFEDYATLRFKGPTPKANKPFGIEKRAALTTSKVVGAPDPPPPYRVKRAYPQLKINYPIHVVHQPGSDRLIVIGEASPYGAVKILRFKDEPGVKDFETLLKLDGVAYDIKFHPSFQRNGYMYVGLNSPLSGASAARKTRVVRYTMSPKPPYALDVKSALTIIEWASDGHNGGALTFGHDGMLYVTSGDGTSDSDTNIRGQDMTKLTAKVLRIDVDKGVSPRRNYSIPKDNPFVGMKDVRPETWAYGLRNPWRMTTDAKTGHIWVGQNGQDLWEQAYLVAKGANYGWSVMEGSHPFYLNRKRGPTPLVAPTVEHPHSEFRSLTGGIVYYGAKHPGLRGAYIYGDYSTGKIWGIRHDGKKPLWHKELATTRLQITGFGTDAKGEILVCDHQGGDKGGLYTLEPTPGDLPPPTFPKTLSASGLFKSVAGHVMEPALIPYSVNAPLWSDGAYKERYLALPGADSTIDFTTNRAWTFPDKTVLVKSFALDMEDGNPTSRRWIETRFLTRQEGEWFGYSYVWNDAQTEGTLVEARGLDKDFTIKVPKAGGRPAADRKMAWHYPSRVECMVCHSRAAVYVLGLNEVQMNKLHDYGKVVDNQLRVLEHLGILRVSYLEETKTKMREEAKARGLSESAINAYMDRQTATRLQREAKISSMLSFAPEGYRKLVDPYDKKQDVALRARSYLHSNCAQCHVEAGGGNAQMELEFTTPLDKMRVVGVKPVHDAFKVPEARLVAPGSPERSVLLHRMSHRGAGHMPPLATAVVDREAVDVVRSWIRGMKPAKLRD